MAEVLLNRHASRGQKGSMDPQDELAAGRPAER